MNLAGARVAVIGGAGFIGSHTVDELLKEDVSTIRVFDNFSRGSRANLQSALRDKRVTIFDHAADICQSDLLDAALRDVDAVFHFAALWLFHCQAFPRAAFRVNIEGTFNVLDACVRAGAKKLVFASSASVYGDSAQALIDESHPFLNRTLYGATKIADEALARAFQHQFGLEYVGLRYMNVYGARQYDEDPQSGVVAQMLKAIDQGRNLTVIGDGRQSLDFVHVSDCARANVLAMKSAANDAFYNVGTGTGTAIIDLARMIIAAHPRAQRTTLEFKPANAIQIRSRVADVRAARRDLGFEAAIALDEGLKATIVARPGAGRESVARPGEEL